MAIFTDAATIAGVTTPSSADVKASVDASSIRSVSTPSAAEIEATIDAANFATTTVVSGTDILFRDAATVGSLSAVTTGEFEFVHPTGYWGPFDTDDGQL